jgi:hypothetical protein
MPAAFRTLLNPTGETDPNFSSVSLLLHMDGANGSTTFTDSGPSGVSATVSGNAKISTSNPKIGTGAGTFDGTGDYLTWSGNSGFDFGTGDFTIEMFFKMPSGMSLGSFGRVLLSNENASWGSGAFTLYGVNSSTGRPTFWVNNYSSGSALLTCSSGDYRDSTWHHLAIVRSGSSCVMYIDGTSVATGTFSGQVGSSSRNLVLATNLVSSRDLQVDVDEFRITKIARYTSNFTATTTAFPDS